MDVRVPNCLSLREGETTSFQFRRAAGARELEGFVLRWQDQLLAFQNECPHWSVELDLGDGHFYDPELDRVYCKNHGALFVLPDGRCETGPCLGRSLTRLELTLDGDDVMVHV